MRLTFCVVTLAIAVLLVSAHAQQSPDHTDTRRVTLKDLSDNIRLRLVAAKISRTRGQYLMIELARISGVGETERIGVHFPSHSHTPHVATLRAIVNSCVKWNKPKDRHEWHQATKRAVFSAPNDSEWDLTDFEKWWLVSLQCPQDD